MCVATIPKINTHHDARSGLARSTRLNTGTKPQSAGRHRGMSFDRPLQNFMAVHIMSAAPPSQFSRSAAPTAVSVTDSAVATPGTSHRSCMLTNKRRMATAGRGRLAWVSRDSARAGRTPASTNPFTSPMSTVK